jgi:hypothetical protein
MIETAPDDPLRGSRRAVAPAAQEFAAALSQHFLKSWFPRCLDLEQGGFLSDFDRVGCWP